MCTAGQNKNKKESHFIFCINIQWRRRNDDLLNFTCDVFWLMLNSKLTFCCTNLQARATVPPFQG